jgi:hypothetical protein
MDLVRRAALVVGLIALGAGSAGADSNQLKRVAGKVTMSQSICRGGVAITQQDVDALPPPAPIPGKEFLVVAGSEISGRKPAARFVTRNDGTFVTRLPPGQWCFFEAGRKPEPEPPGQPAEPPRAHPLKAAGPNIDKGCLESERRRCDLVLAVKSDVKQADIRFTQRCPDVWAQPCYRGPMPP